VNFDDMAKLFAQGIADHSGALKPLVLSLGVVGVKWGLLWFLYRRGIFFRL
jgi:hypothetical protein